MDNATKKNGIDEKNIYGAICLSDLDEIFNAISEAGGSIKAATIYKKWSEKAKFEACALCRNERWHMWINHLPQYGYCTSNLDVEGAMDSYIFFTHLPITYQQAVFCRKEKELILVIPEKKEARRCRILNWTNHGRYATFEVQCEGEESTRTLGHHTYEKEWIFLDSMT